MTLPIADLRREYKAASLRKRDVAADPIEQFRKWFGEAVAVEVPEPNAMTLATADAAGHPSARTVLMKVVDERGFAFFTNYTSRKASDLDANPHAALVFYWPQLERQVCIRGSVTKTSRAESEEYWRQRPAGSRLGALASDQSQVVPDREHLESRLATLTAEFAGKEIPLLGHWGGFRLAPETIEFWQGRENRLHDRLRYRREGDRWVIERLSP